MKFATHQPAFLPWPGLVYKASRVDRLVLLDEVQFPRGFSWVNRNRLKGMHGVVWFTVPVMKKGQGLQKINQVRVLPEERWRKKHVLTLEHCYKRAPFFQEHMAFLEELYSRAPSMLLGWNLAAIDHIFRSFGMNEPHYILQSELRARGRGTGLILDVAERLGASTLVAPRPAKASLDMSILKRAGLEVEWLDYTSPVYPQLWGEFLKDLSAMDLLFNCGPYGREILERAQRPG